MLARWVLVLTKQMFFPVQLSDLKFHTVYVIADKQPQGVLFQYGHLSNNDVQSNNLSSFIDGSETEFLAEDTDLLSFGQSIPMVPKGQQSGMSIAGVYLTYVTKIGLSYIYDISIIFMISSFFEDITNLQTNTPPSQVFDANSLTDNFLVVGYPKYNNPNIQIQNNLNDTQRLGNTGWFDENFNGLANDFTLSSLKLF